MYAVIALIVAMLIMPGIAVAQDQEYQLIKSESSETFAFPYEAANHEMDAPLVYTYDKPKGPSWILSITNNLTYSSADNAKTIVRVQEPAPSEKYIEIAMYGGEARKFWVAVNKPEAGYAKLYDNKVNGWSTESSIALSHVDTGGLSVTDGKRIIIDRFNMEGFTVGSISVYGRDDAAAPPNASEGKITFDILYGSFRESPLYLVPALVMAGIAGLVVTLLVIKKRKPSD